MGFAAVVHDAPQPYEVVVVVLCLCLTVDLLRGALSEQQQGDIGLHLPTVHEDVCACAASAPENP